MAEQQDIGHEEAGPSGRRSAPRYRAQHFPPGDGDQQPEFRTAWNSRAQSPNPQRSNSPNSPHSAQNSLPNSPNQPPSPQYLLRLMPYRTDRNAPKFDGKARSLPRFFEDIEVLARDCGVTEPELIAQTLRYLDGSDYDTWRSRPTASGNNWEDFKQEIMSMYPGAEDDSLYSITDLEIFVERHASSPLRDRVQFGSYYRDFLTRSDWLFDQGLISNRERNKFFMNGFHIDFRNQLRMQLRLQDPFHALDEPWEVETVAQAVLFLLDSPNSRNLLTFSSPPQVPHNSPPVNLPSPPNTSNHVSRPTFDMSSIEHILMSDAFINRLASRIPTSTSVQQSLPANINTSRTYWPCGMCSSTEHMFRNCSILDDYLHRGLCKRDSTNRICVPDGIQITQQLAPGRNMKERIDNWHKTHPQVQSNILEVSISPSQGTTIPLSASSLTCSEPTTSYDEEIARLDAIALAAIKRQGEIKKRAGNTGKDKNTPASAECTNPDTSTTPKTNTTKSSTSITPQSSTTAPAPQYRFASPIEDSGTIQSVIKRSLDGTVTLTQKELYAIAPDVRKHIKEQITTHRVPSGQSTKVSSIEEVLDDPQTTSLAVVYHNPSPPSNPIIVANHVEDLRTISLEINNKIVVDAILDEGSQIIGIHRGIWEKLSLPLLKEKNMLMEAANSSKEMTLGLLRDLPVSIGSNTFYLQVQVFETAPYEMLLGRPFLTLTQAKTRHYANGDSEITLHDPNTQELLTIPTRTRIRPQVQSKSGF